MSDEGHIEVIFGPMFSGKSTELLRKVRRYEHAKKKCLVINYLHDNRYSSENVMSTHDKIIRKAIKTADLSQLLQTARQYDVVAIDQGQFFSDIVQFCEQLANNGTIIMVAALDGTFQRKGFGNILNLLPVAEKVVKLSAVCVYCASEAHFTQRIVESQEVQLVGGEQSYKPVCRKCFLMKDKSKSECSSNDSSSKKKSQIQEKEQNPQRLVI